ncbi:MAG: alpha/beta hydrolase [Nitrospinae bacterium]|nr:alpha/beta hydrolase [Nitrospinota bacterium]MBL7020179.1 alpha/beta hydrolase [Nitrospinaceae bacterium]
MTWTQSAGLLVLFVLAYVAFLLLFENKIIFYPDRYPKGFWNPVSAGVPAQDIYFKAEDGVKLHGWFIPAPNAVATLLWFHGNAGNLSHRLDNIHRLKSLNLNIFIFDYRGYGRSEGVPDEEGIYKDSSAAYKKVLELEGVSVDSLFLFGRSLGGICAVETAMSHPARGLILESVFTNAADMSRQVFPLIPLGWAIRSKLDAVSKVPHLKLAKLFLHGTHDEIVPYDLGRKLFEQAAEPKTFYPIEGAGHNDTYILGGLGYFDALNRFITETLQNSNNRG